jgi:hypothetical protein
MEEHKDSTLDLQTVVQEHVLPAVSELKALQEKLRSLRDSLPAPSGQDEEREMDAVTELRSVIDCVLVDSLGPAGRDLAAVAVYVSRSREPEER